MDKYPEIDFFGYLKTEKGSGGKKRSAKVRLSNAISLESYKGDLDFLTNKGQADKIGENMNIAQAEIHSSYYRYTITADLDQIGEDVVYGISLDIGVYDIKNPVFQNVVSIKDNCIDVSEIQGVLFDCIKDDTYCGVVNKSFDNTTELKDQLKALSMPEFFAVLKQNVDAYYESN